MKILCTIAALSLLMNIPSIGATWDGGKGSADAACKERVDESGAYKFVGARPYDGGKKAECVMKIKEGEGSEVVDVRVVQDDPPPEEEKKEKKDSAAASGTPPKDDDKFPAKCVAFTSPDWAPELDAAYKTLITQGGAQAGLALNQNVAVLEWKDKGQIKRQWFTSTMGQQHSEEHILAYLGANNIKREDVKRIYTELSPCEAKCLPALNAHFQGMRKKVKIEFSWFHANYQDFQNCGHQPGTQQRMEQKKWRRDKVTAK